MRDKTNCNEDDFNAFAKKTEWEADGKVPNSPEILKAMAKYFEKEASRKKMMSANSPIAPSNQSPIHPSDEERAEQFHDRYDKLSMNFRNPAFCERFLGTPKIFGTSPGKAAEILGLDPHYYPTLSSDMISLFKPSPLVHYTFKNRNFTTSHTTRYWQNALK